MFKRFIAAVCTSLTVLGVLILTPTSKVNAYQQQQKCAFSLISTAGQPSGFTAGFEDVYAWRDGMAPGYKIVILNTYAKLNCDSTGAVGCETCFRVKVFKYSSSSGEYDIDYTNNVTIATHEGTGGATGVITGACNAPTIMDVDPTITALPGGAYKVIVEYGQLDSEGNCTNIVFSHWMTFTLNP